MTDDFAAHMSAEDFRRHGHAMIDWIADYHARVESLPVLSRVAPGEIMDALPAHPPESGEPFEAMMRDVERVIMPGLTHWQSPNFFAFFPANVSGPAILGELLSAGLGVQGMLWLTSPACTELETRVLDWVAEMLDLPTAFRSTTRGGGVIQDTASSATLCALLAGRERATGFATNAAGIDRRLRVYASREAHSSFPKSVKIAGIGEENLRLIDVDATGALVPEHLEAAIDDDVRAGFVPCLVGATVGTTSSNGLDPVPAIGAIARRHGVWLHVDAAAAGSAAVCPEFRFIHDGLELADSYCFNPHKWLLTNFDCDCFYVADREALVRTLSVTPEYLRNPATETGAVFDYRDWHVPLGRRFRALKLWFVIRHYGVEGLRAFIRHHVALTRSLAARIAAEPRLVLAADAPLNLICFRHVDGDEPTRVLHERLNDSGRLYVTHTRLDDRYVIRFCIGGTHTAARHVDDAWSLVTRTLDDIAAGAGMLET